MSRMSTAGRRNSDFILYLDLDGVVQHESVLWHPRRGIYMDPCATGRRLFEWVPILEDALAPFPEVSLVLSSSWCIRPGYEKTLKRFPESIRSRFVGGTYHRRIHGADPGLLASFRETARGLQVWADVQRRKPLRWLALDDDVHDWPASTRDHLIACDGTSGLSCPTVQAELREKLTQGQEALATQKRGN
jgi:hypothetical protein